MSLGMFLGTHLFNTKRATLIEKIGHHLYRVQMDKGHDRKPNTYIGCGFDWKIAATEEPFQHLPYESFLAVSVLNFVCGEHVPASIEGYLPGRIAHNIWGVTTTEKKRYIGFLNDWKHRETEQLIDDPKTQAGLSWYLLHYLCRYKELKYEAQAEKEMFHQRMGIPHDGYRREGEEGSSER